MFDDPYEIAKETARRYRECSAYSDSGKILHQERHEHGAQKSIAMTFETRFSRPYDLHYSWHHDDEKDSPIYGYSAVQFLTALKAKGEANKKATDARQKAFAEMCISPDDNLVNTAVASINFFRHGWQKPKDTPAQMLWAAGSLSHGTALIVVPLIFGTDQNFVKYSLNGLDKAYMSKSSVIDERNCYVLDALCASYPFIVKYFICKDEFLIRRAISSREINPDTMPAKTRQTFLDTGQSLGKICFETRIDFENVQRQ